MAQKILLIGARGVGKSQLLRRWPGSVIPVDLDQVIEEKTSKSIPEIFETQGEAFFRQLERESLQELLLGPDKTVIAVGAGFRWDDFEWPISRNDVEIIWVRRATDNLGRIFLDRPRLDTAVSALQEFWQRLAVRDPKNQQISDRTYMLPEGLLIPTSTERQILENKLPETHGVLTLTPNNLRWNWPGPVEVRTDLWGESEFSKFQQPQILWAIRDAEKWKKILVRSQDWVDWPLEMGPVDSSISKNPNLILSLHEFEPGESLRQATLRLAGRKALHYKFSPLVLTWDELESGLHWQQEDPERRSFLPRSPDGRWKWFRLFMGARQRINFVQDGTNPIPDQPTFFEWFGLPNRYENFGAVLGDPVFHSRSPMEQRSFFESFGWPFFAIRIARDEWQDAIPRLRSWGLKAAAVTSPLKYEADPTISNNTLYWDHRGQMHATNTDRIGFEKTLAGFQDLRAVIWGGGGTLAGVQEFLPQAAPYSARTGQPKNEKVQHAPQLLIWAAGPRDPSPGNKEWRPQLVIDLNYREDSEARSYALQVGAQYRDGSELFRVQALGQREFWKHWMPK